MEWKIIEIGGEKWVKVEGFVDHRRSKNYVALIDGTHPDYKYSRKFLKFKTIDKEHYIPLSDFIDGGIYEVQFIYYTSGGKPNPEVSGRYIIEKRQDKVIFTPITEKEILDRLAVPQEDTNLKKIFELLKEVADESLDVVSDFIKHLKEGRKK